MFILTVFHKKDQNIMYIYVYVVMKLHVQTKNKKKKKAKTWSTWKRGTTISWEEICMDSSWFLLQRKGNDFILPPGTVKGLSGGRGERVRVGHSLCFYSKITFFCSCHISGVTPLACFLGVICSDTHGFICFDLQKFQCFCSSLRKS